MALCLSGREETRKIRLALFLKRRNRFRRFRPA
jgi:hypothetical protein